MSVIPAKAGIQNTHPSLRLKLLRGNDGFNIVFISSGPYLTVKILNYSLCVWCTCLSYLIFIASLLVDSRLRGNDKRWRYPFFPLSLTPTKTVAKNHPHTRRVLDMYQLVSGFRLVD